MHPSRPNRRRVAVIAAATLTAALVPVIGSATTATATPTELFISEYVEGASNDKALEFYNGTGAPVDLAAGGYNVQMFFNGNPVPGLTINLTGTVADGDVHVLAHSLASAAILSQADQTNGSGWFNGDDAVVLRKGATTIDAIGQVGFDPGSEWGSGVTSTADNTLRRKAEIEVGDANQTNTFDPAVQWDGFANSTVDGLGVHSQDAAPTVVSTSPSAGASGVTLDSDVTVTFSEPVDATDASFTLTCTLTGAKSVELTGGPETFTLNPGGDFVNDETCMLTVVAAKVSDRDAVDPPDAMTADRVVFFTTPEVTPCTVPFTPVPAIQGSGAAVPSPGLVATEGVVVGDHEGPSPKLRGFYIQDPSGDGDAATSDAIFVFNGNSNDVAVGDLVRVTGTSTEFQDQSQVTAVGVTHCGEATVPPTDVTFPVASGTFLERYEGMLVRLPQEMTVTEHFQLGRFGQVVISQGGRLQQPTNVASPGAGALALQTQNNQNKIILDDSSQVQNPDPIMWSRDGGPLTATNTLRGGDTVTGAIGVMTYTWAGNAASGNAYRLRPIGALGGKADFVAVNPRPSSPPEVGGTVQVSAMNLLNFFNTFSGCTNGVGGAATECRGANNQVEFDRQWPKTVAAIRGLGAEVIGVNEIENDGYGATSALAFLVDKLNAVDGAGTWAYVDVDTRTGQPNALGTDAIKVGMLYRPAAVAPVGTTGVLNTVEFVNGGDSAPRSRPALAQAFHDRATGGVFTAVVNHFKSKGSACGVPDAGDGQGNCNAVRVRSATALAEWLATDPTGTGDADRLILGDLNSYAMEDPITVLRGAGYTNLIAKELGPDAYSYVFDGQWGYLDHALGSPSMTAQVAGVADWHVNADEPSVLDYNTEFKSDNLKDVLYAPDQYRVSDHDPVIVGLELTPAFVTAGGWIGSPAGALVANPQAKGKGQLQLVAKYENGATSPSGSLAFAIDGVPFEVASTSIDRLMLAGTTAHVSGSATVNGASGHRFEVTTTDGVTSIDTFRLVVRDANDDVIYDSGSQTVKGQVSLHD